MRLVVDANVMFSFFRSESVVRTVILDPELKFGLELFAPQLLLSQLDKHKSEICAKAGISGDEYKFPRGALETFVKVIPDKFWQDRKAEASELLQEHPKDIPYFALALKLLCPIWSNEKLLKKQSAVEVLSTKELLELLE